jgi:hypothetical protein
LNGWLTGFDPILKRMKPGNFNWLLHSMLFYHTKFVIQKQDRKKGAQQGNRDQEGEDGEEL